MKLPAALLIVILAAAAWGQSAAPPRRSIGLALGGGGALGFTHVGVIAWMEEHRIPIDYVAGTSMGAIVGGMYATGRDPDSMRKLVAGVDWDRMFRSNPEFRNLGFRRKEDRRLIPNSIEFGLRSGFRTRPGVTAGQELAIFLDRALLNYSGDISFDSLPTPFRCVATDLVSADPVVLDHGSLPEALRASTAIPGVFTPVEQNGRVLIDGGLAENLPTGVVKAMGADVVIAISLPGAKIEQQSLESLAGVLARSVSVAIIQNERRSAALANVVVSPDIGDYGNFSYKAAEDLIRLGHESAERESAKLLPYALDEAAWAQYQERRRSRIRTAPPVPEMIVVEGVKPEAETRIEAGLANQVGKPLDPSKVEKQLALAEGSGRYDAGEYRLENRDGKPALVVRLQPKRYGPPFLYAGLDINGEDPRNVTFSFLTRIVLLDIGGFDSEWRNTIGVGQHTVLDSEYYRRLGSQGWFVAPSARYNRDLTDVFKNGVGLSEYVVERTAVGVDAGYTWPRLGEMRAGFETGHLTSRLRIGTPLDGLVDDGYKVFTIRFAYDGQDSPAVPSRGLRLNVRGQYYPDGPATGDFFLAQTEGSWFHSPNERNEIFTVFGGGSSFGQHLPLPLQFTLGRPLALGALRVDELRGDRYLYGTVGYLRPLAKFPRLLGDRLFAGGWASVGALPSSLDSRTWYDSVTLGIVAETSLGPFYLGASIGDRGRKQVAFRLGRFF